MTGRLLLPLLLSLLCASLPAESRDMGQDTSSGMRILQKLMNSPLSRVVFPQKMLKSERSRPMQLHLERPMKDRREGLKHRVQSHGHAAVKSPHQQFKGSKVVKPMNFAFPKHISKAAPPLSSSTKVEEKRLPKPFVMPLFSLLQQVYQEKERKKPGRGELDTSSSTWKKQNQRPKLQSGSSKHKPNSDSGIHVIRLPAVPYSYVPGLGYISQPPSFSAASLATKFPSPTATAIASDTRGKRPTADDQQAFIKLPIDFVSNGKPSSVYRISTKGQPTKPVKEKDGDYDLNVRPHQVNRVTDSPIVKLNAGPYTFNGKPVSVYHMKRASPSMPNRF